MTTANNNVVHSTSCPANNVVVYRSHVHTDYLIQWCASCCRTGITPVVTITVNIEEDQ